MSLLTFGAAVISYALDQSRQHKCPPPPSPSTCFVDCSFKQEANVIPLASLPPLVCSGEHKTTHCPVNSEN